MLTKEESKMLHGIAILAMVALHLFCRKDALPYNAHLFMGGVPLVYYFGLFGDICVPIYCFTSGYAQALLSNTQKDAFARNRWKRLLKFVCHFWIVLVLFSIVGFIVGDEQIPGSFGEFIGNFFMYNFSYNGAWWFVLTYVFLIVMTPAIIKVVNKWNPWLLFTVSGFAYVISYIFYFDYKITFEFTVLGWCWHQLLLFTRSLFPYIVGAIFYRYHLFEKLKKVFSDNCGRRVLIVVTPILLFVFHAKIQSLIVAPITALGCVICFYLWKKPKWIQFVFTFFGNHSTNIWLIHMFFYATLFENFIFILQEPALIYVGMLVVCIVLSYGVFYLEAQIKWFIKGIKRVHLK